MMISARSEDEYYYIFIDIFIDEEKIFIDNITNFYSFNKIILNFFFFYWFIYLMKIHFISNYVILKLIYNIINDDINKQKIFQYFELWFINADKYLNNKFNSKNFIKD